MLVNSDTLPHRTDVLLLAGMKSKYVVDTEAIHKEMMPGLCSIIKVESAWLFERVLPDLVMALFNPGKLCIKSYLKPLLRTSPGGRSS